MVSHRHAAANNPYMDDYDETRPSSYLLYLDANNLYGWAMSQALPTGGFEWVRNNIQTFCGSRFMRSEFAIRRSLGAKS